MGDLTKNFSRHEFACNCGCGADRISLILVDKLQNVRDMFGKRIDINSGVRCKAHNKAVGGSEDSEHLPAPGDYGVGEGADLECAHSRHRYLLIKAMYAAGFKRIGPDDKFVHAGIRASKPQEQLWLY